MENNKARAEPPTDARPPRALLDAGVVLAALGGAVAGASADLLDLARRGRVRACIGADALAIVYDELGHATAMAQLRALRRIVAVAAVDAGVVDDALSSDRPDLVAALTLATARRADLDLILSLTPDDFTSDPPAMEPAVLIVRIGAGRT